MIFVDSLMGKQHREKELIIWAKPFGDNTDKR
ncbi:MAG: hypothetical protein JWN40_1597 [Phycisphaerales bacterium]|nr:hypothetical protein [Phycisphaerales bacterium]